MPDKPLDMLSGLTSIRVTIAQMQMSPDADKQFLDDLAEVVEARAHGGAQQGQQGQPGQGQGQPQPGQGQPGGPSGSSPFAGGPSGGAPQPQGPSGVSPQQAQQMQARGLQPRHNMGMTDPDELRRLLLTRAGK